MRRLLPLLLIALLLVSVIPALAQQNIKETKILTWNGSAWVRLLNGQLCDFGGDFVCNKYQRITVAAINTAVATGIPLLLPVKGMKYRLINATIAAYGGACTSTNATSLEIISDPAGTPVILYQVLKAQLAEATTAGVGRNLMVPCTASTVLLADNASFVQQVANKGISLITTGTSVDWATATGVDVWLTYAVAL
jgi:hypothetical protein